MAPWLTQNWAQFFSASYHRKTFWGLKGAPHKNKIGLHGCLRIVLDAFKIPRKGADLQPHSGIQLPKSFQFQEGITPLT